MRIRALYMILFVLSFITGCENPTVTITENLDPENTPSITSIVAFGNPETGMVFTTYYRTQTQEKDTLQNCFYYRLDSVISRDGRKEHAGKDFEASSQSFCTSTAMDTFFVNFRANPPAPSFDQHSYSLVDSLEIPLTSGPIKIYSYKNNSDDPKWDETAYFSTDIGFIYSHYPYYKKKYELVKHSSIGDSELLQIMDSLKLRSGELTKAAINSRKKSH